LIVRRAPEDGAEPIFHQHEVRDIDGQRLSLDERMLRLGPGIEAHLFSGLDRGFGRADPLAFGDEVGERFVRFR
jgi:hypothetical protein